MLNDMIENASNICKAFLKHAESLEGSFFSSPLNLFS